MNKNILLIFFSLISFWGCKIKELNFLDLQSKIKKCETYESLIKTYNDESIELSDKKLFMKTSIVYLNPQGILIVKIIMNSTNGRGIKMFNKLANDSFQFDYDSDKVQSIIINESGTHNLKNGLINDKFDYLISVVNNKVLIFETSTKQLFYLFKRPPAIPVWDSFKIIYE